LPLLSDNTGKFKMVAINAGLSEQTGQAAVCLVTDYISRHRRRTTEALSKLPPEQLKHIRDVRLRYRPDLPGRKCFDEIRISPDADVEEVCRAAVAFNQCRQADQGTLRESHPARRKRRIDNEEDPGFLRLTV